MPPMPWTRRDGVESDSDRKWRIFWSYFPDWVLTILLWGLFYLLDKIDGFRRLFSVTDTSLAHPYAEHERVPVWLLAVICGLIPAILMILNAAILQRSFWDAHSAILGFILNLGLSVTFTDIVKITVGRPRPDLFGRCDLPEDLTSNPVHGLTSWESCQNYSLLQDGFRSFPSGHSSFAWGGMWYLVLYFAAKMRINNRRGYTWKSWLLLAPISCAALVAISRTMDYRHHATDVIAGGIIGILTSWYSYRQYYPPLAAPQSWKPYSPRIARLGHGASDAKLPLHQKRSDEAGRQSQEPLTANGDYQPSASGYPPAHVSGIGGSSDGNVRSEDRETVPRAGT